MMKPTPQSPNANLQLPRESGLISLISVLIISAAALSVGLIFTTVSLSELQHSYFEGNSDDSFYLAESCLEEAFIRLKRDNSYTTGTLALLGESCSLLVTANGSARTVETSSTVDGFVRRITATSTVVGAAFNLKNWTEYAGF